MNKPQHEADLRSTIEKMLYDLLTARNLEATIKLDAARLALILLGYKVEV